MLEYFFGVCPKTWEGAKYLKGLKQIKNWWVEWAFVAAVKMPFCIFAIHMLGPFFKTQFGFQF